MVAWPARLVKGVAPGASDQPQKVHDLLNLLGNPEVQKWIAAQKDAAPVAAKPGVGDEAEVAVGEGEEHRLRRALGEVATS